MLIPIGLILAFILIALFANRATRGCRWRQDRPNAQSGGMAWHCAACGAKTQTKDRAPPKRCLRPKA